MQVGDGFYLLESSPFAPALEFQMKTNKTNKIDVSEYIQAIKEVEHLFPAPAKNNSIKLEKPIDPEQKKVLDLFQRISNE